MVTSVTYFGINLDNHFYHTFWDIEDNSVLIHIPRPNGMLQANTIQEGKFYTQYRDYEDNETRVQVIDIETLDYL